MIIPAQRRPIGIGLVLSLIVSGPFLSNQEIPSRLRILRVSPPVLTDSITAGIRLSHAIGSELLEVFVHSSPALVLQHSGDVFVGGLPARAGPAPVIRVQFGAESATYGAAQGLRAVPSRDAVAGTQRAETLYVEAVIPPIARPGDTVFLRLRPRLTGSDTISGVTMAGRIVQWQVTSRNELALVVPDRLGRSDTLPPIVVYADPRPVAAHVGLRVEVPLLTTGQLVLVVWLAGAMAAGVYLARRYPDMFRRWLWLARARLPAEATTPTASPPQAIDSIPLPDVPQELVEACARDDCVLYAGAGLSAQAGLPTWQAFLEELLKWAISENHIDEGLGSSLMVALERGGGASVADTIVNRVERTALHEELQRLFAITSSRLPRSHRALAGIGFSAVLTTNFDGLLERTFADKVKQPYTHLDTEPLLDALQQRRFFVLKLYGTLEQPDTMLVGPAQFRDAVSRNRAFAAFMEATLRSRTLFFVGASLDGILGYLDGVAFRASESRRHFALTAVTDRAWRGQADLLSSRYNITVLPFTAGNAAFPEVPRFLDALRVATLRQQASPAQASDQVGTSAAPLAKVILNNIGAFEGNLELELDRQCNVLLGDNGVGKSTILKAIGLALYPREAESYAYRLLRQGTDKGSITLITGSGNRYVTELNRKRSGEVEVVAGSARPSDAEGFLSLGFSPVRIGTWKRSKGPSFDDREKAARRHAGDDVLPLVVGEADPRMDSVKQFLVNVDYVMKDEASRGESGRFGMVRDEFFTAMTALSKGLKFEPGTVNAQEGIVNVLTDDGEVPIESVSQGTASLLGWVGILVRRLSEVYPTRADIRNGAALVLLDEIDAHMHPLWQQTLIHELLQLFPNVQFIVTTHSPLIVRGLTPERLFRFERRDGKLVTLKVADDASMGRPDQVLSGELFDLPVGVDPWTKDPLLEYKTLLSLKELSDDQRKRLHQLEDELEVRIPMPTELTPERRAQQLIEAMLMETTATDEAKQNVVERAAQLLRAVGGQPEAPNA